MLFGVQVMWRIKLLVVVFLSIASWPALAVTEVVANSVQVWSNIYGDNRIRVATPGQSVVNSSSCADPDSYMVLTTIPKEAQARIYATLLTAKGMGKPVVLHVEGCESGRPAIVSVYF